MDKLPVEIQELIIINIISQHFNINNYHIIYLSKFFFNLAINHMKIINKQNYQPYNIKNVNDLSEKVYGYFYASSIVSDKLFIGGDSIRAPVSPCIVIDPVYSEACMECLSLPKSTRRIPSYWPKD